MLLIVLYDIFYPYKPPSFMGKTISLTGRVRGIKGYDVRFGERSYRLRLEDGPPELKQVFVNVKESLLLNICHIEEMDVSKREAEIETKLYGSIISCKGELEAFDEASNPGHFDSGFYYRNEGVAGSLKADEINMIKSPETSGDFLGLLLHRLNSAISKKYQNLLGTKNAGSLSAMVLGDKSSLDEEIKELYQENSISHLLSISGLHISLVGGAVYLFLKKIKSGFKFSLIIASTILLLYGMFSGFSVSTTRAVLMMCILFASFLIGRSYDLPSALALAAIAILIGNHRLIYQSGFQLSFLAVVGIFYILPELLYIFNVDFFNTGGIKKFLYIIFTSIICSISINLATLPVILSSFYEISLIGILLNIIVIPLMSVVLITGLVGGFVALIMEAAGSFILASSYYILNFYTFLCKIGDGLTFGRLILGKPEKWQIFIYYFILFAVIYFLSKRRRVEKIARLKNELSANSVTSRRTFITFSIICLSLIVLTYKKEEFSLNMLDIGQGDCFVINGGRGNIYISDCGSTSAKEVGKYRLLPFLKANGWNRVRAIFVSHMDKDHVNGVNDLLKCPEIAIDKIIISTSYKSEKLNCAELEELKNLAAGRNIGLFYMKKGDRIEDGELKFNCLYPAGSEDIEDQNEASLVIRMDYGKLSALFTGDIGSVTEEEVMRITDREELNCDILKVCHHGSKNSSKASFLAEVDPQFYLVSCGLMNRYGHPHKSTLERMGEEGGRVLRTDHMGSVRLRIGEEKLHIYYKSKNLSAKNFIPSKECDCEDCYKVNTHFNYKNR